MILKETRKLSGKFGGVSAPALQIYPGRYKTQGAVLVVGRLPPSVLGGVDLSTLLATSPSFQGEEKFHKSK